MSRPRTRRAPAPLSGRPGVLYSASLERIYEAEALQRLGRWTLSTYAAGLSVEALLQAFAIMQGATFDARHDLSVWLTKGPRRLVDAVKGEVLKDWSHLSSVWTNGLRYLSEDALLGHLRDRGLDRNIGGGRVAVLKVNCARCVRAARAVHQRGLVVWQQQH